VRWRENPAGKDSTNVFFGLHRHEVLLKPQYARLQIGKIHGQEEVVKPLLPGEISEVPYAEPTWLNKGFHSPYYNDGHKRFHKAARRFFVEVVYPDAIKCEESGKRISQDVVDKLWSVFFLPHQSNGTDDGAEYSEMNILAMRLGPGKHLQGRTLLGGVIGAEEYDHFHEVRSTSWTARVFSTSYS
jgi:hypothetical protein